MNATIDSQVRIFFIDKDKSLHRNLKNNLIFCSFPNFSRIKR